MTRARTLADMISDGVIGTTELANDVITPVKLDETGTYAVAGINVGTGSELQIYNSGTSGIIKDAGAGDIKILADDFYLQNAAGSATLISVLDTGKVGLGFAGVEKLATSSTGIDVTGTVTADGLTVSNSSLQVKLEEADGSYNPRLITYFDSSGTHLQHTWSNAASNLIFEIGGSEGSGTERMRIDGSGNVGIGAVPVGYASVLSALQLGGNANIAAEKTTGASQFLHISQNANFDTDNSWEYISTDEATSYYQNNGTHVWRHAASGTAGNDISWSESMRIDSSGNVGIGVASLVNPLEVNVTANTNTKSTGSAFDGAAVRLNATGGMQSTGSEIALLAGGNDSLSAGIGFMRESNTTWGTALKFYTHEAATSGATDDLQEVMRIDSSGKVGIGTGQPSTPLHVVGNNGILVDTQGNGDGQIYFGGISGSDRSYLSRSLNDFAMWNVSNGIIKFGTNDTERMRLENSGAVIRLGGTNSSGFVDFNGVALQLNTQRNPETGTFSASGRAHCYIDLNDGNGTASNSHIRFGTAATNGVTGSERGRFTSAGNLLLWHKLGIGLSEGSVASDADISIGSATPSIFFHDTTGGQNNAAIKVDNGKIIFLNGATGSNVSDQNHRMTLTSDGVLVVGETQKFLTGTDGDGNGAGDGLLCVASNNNTAIRAKRKSGNGSVVAFYRGGTTASRGSIDVSGTGVTYTSVSDYRLKENVDYAWDATARLKQLKPARFNFISDDTNTLVDGFLAHEVSSIVPEAISGKKDAVEVWTEEDELPEGISVGENKIDDDGNTIPIYQGVDHSRLVPLLVKTIQELEARITALEAG